MSDLPGGGYPAAYKRRAMHSMSSLDTATRLEMRMNERAFIGPRNLIVPPRTRSQDLRDAAPASPSTGGGRRTVEVPRRLGMDPNVGTTESMAGWRERDRARLGPKTITLGPDEYRRIKTAGESGSWRRAFREAWRAARRAVRGKDLRLELALRILDMIWPGADPDHISEGTEIIFGPGWTSGPKCSTAPHHFDSTMIWQNMTSGCLPLQAGVGDNGTGPFLQGRVPTSGYNEFRLVWGMWARHPTLDRANHHQSHWTARKQFGGGPANWPKSIEEFISRTSGNWYKRPTWAAGTRRFHGYGAKPWQNSGRFGRIGGYAPPTNAEPMKPLPSKKNDQKYAISFNNKSWYGRLVNGVTEVNDLIDIAYGALGKKCAGAKTPQDKVACIHKNWQTMHWDRFLYGLVENQIEDYVWGRIGQLSAKGARKNRRSTGYQLGPWDTEFSYHTRGMGLEFSFPGP